MTTMALGFDILGPVAVGLDGVPVPLPPGRPLILLTALLLGHGRQVPTERLLAALWDEPPASAAANLRTYVGRLRPLLGRHGDRLARSGGGYALSVDPGELDLHRWTEHLAEAQRAGQIAPGEAADRLAGALALWRGTAAEGVPRRGWLGRMLEGLDEARRAGTERYARACIDAGRFDAAIDCLQPFVAEHPTREVAWHHLVLALSMVGDRCGALAAYSAARRSLVTEVGIEPGPELRRLQQRLLHTDDDDPTATATATATASTPTRPAVPEPRRESESSVPVRTLPPDIELVGRDELLDMIVDEFADPARPAVVALHGPAGAGKSVLAVRAAWQLAPRYPDGQLYLDLCGSSPGLAPVTLAEALACLLRALGVRSTRGAVHEELADLRAALVGRRMLFVLDNVVDARQVRRLLSGIAGAGVLLTSRTVLSALDVRRHVTVAELAPTASLSLLARCGGGTRVNAAPDDAHAVATLCGHLPLALRIIGARLASRPDWSLAAMVTRLADEQHRLDELAFDDLAVRAGLALSCRTLAERPGGAEAVAVFSGWGAISAPTLGVDLARVLTGGPVWAARAALDRLAEARLIEPADEDRYRMHDLVRIYAMERGRDDLPQTDRERALHRIRCYYLATVRRARDLLRVNPHRAIDGFVEAEPVTVLDDQRAALNWLESERVNLVTAVRHAVRERTATGDLFAARLVGELNPFLPMRGYYRDWRELSEAALTCARRLGSRRDEAVALTQLAGARGRMGQHREAIAALRTALALRERDGDQRSVALALDHLGMALANAGLLGDAKIGFERAIALHRGHEDPRRLGVSLNNLADAHLKLGETAEALRHLWESLELRRALGDLLGVGVTTLTIGQVYAHDGKHEQAFGWLDEALGIARDSGNREAEWRALTVRADLHRACGRPDRARRDLTAALTLFTEIGDDAGAARVRRALHDLSDAGRPALDRASPPCSAPAEHRDHHAHQTIDRARPPLARVPAADGVVTEEDHRSGR